MTDRFAMPSNATNANQACDTSALKYCGGTWQGIIEHLDYIQDLGFDAVWISPTVKNIEGATAKGEAFHG